MLITVKIRYACSKQKFESFGDNRYLVYLMSAHDEAGMMEELLTLLSRGLGVPPTRIALKKDAGGDKVFELF